MNNRKNLQNNQKARRNRRRNNRNRNVEFELPVINNSPIQTRCLRYIGTITSSTGVTATSLLGIVVGCTNSSTSVYNLFSGIKIRRIGVTCLPNSATNAGTFAFLWTGADEHVPPVRKTMLYSNGVPTHWNFYPPEDSLAGYWIDSGSTGTVFELDPDNSTMKLVIDLDFEYVLGNGSSTTATLSVASTFTGVGYRYLDWASGGADELTPVDLNLVN